MRCRLLETPALVRMGAVGRAGCAADGGDANHLATDWSVKVIETMVYASFYIWYGSWLQVILSGCQLQECPCDNGCPNCIVVRFAALWSCERHVTCMSWISLIWFYCAWFLLACCLVSEHQTCRKDSQDSERIVNLAHLVPWCSVHKYLSWISAAALCVCLSAWDRFVMNHNSTCNVLELAFHGVHRDLNRQIPGCGDYNHGSVLSYPHMILPEAPDYMQCFASQQVLHNILITWCSFDWISMLGYMNYRWL